MAQALEPRRQLRRAGVSDIPGADLQGVQPAELAAAGQGGLGLGGAGRGGVGWGGTGRDGVGLGGAGRGGAGAGRAGALEQELAQVSGKEEALWSTVLKLAALLQLCDCGMLMRDGCLPARKGGQPPPRPFKLPILLLFLILLPLPLPAPACPARSPHLMCRQPASVTRAAKRSNTSRPVSAARNSMPAGRARQRPGHEPAHAFPAAPVGPAAFPASCSAPAASAPPAAPAAPAAPSTRSLARHIQVSAAHPRP